MTAVRQEMEMEHLLMRDDFVVWPRLPVGYSGRVGEPADATAVSALMNGYWEPLVQARKFTPEGKLELFHTPGFDTAGSTHLVESAGGELVGYAVVLDLIAPPVHPGIWGCVTPEHQRCGIGAYLMAWAEGRARQAIERTPPGVRVAAQTWIMDAHEPTRKLMEARGFAPKSYSRIMNIGLATAPAAPILPEGIVANTFREAPNLRAVIAADIESFRDHRGYVEQNAAEVLERWEHFVAHDPNFDPDLWFLAMNGDEIVGISLCAPRLGDEESIGVVETLGVRREWRRRGVGMALLLHSFHELRRRGKRTVTLSVDAHSLTGATRLYERAGMHIYRQMAMYELELRPGEEVSTQALS